MYELRFSDNLYDTEEKFFDPHIIPCFLTNQSNTYPEDGSGSTVFLQL